MNDRAINEEEWERYYEIRKHKRYREAIYSLGLENSFISTYVIVSVENYLYRYRDTPLWKKLEGIE